MDTGMTEFEMEMPGTGRRVLPLGLALIPPRHPRPVKDTRRKKAQKSQR